MGVSELDVLIEKIVKKKKTAYDYISTISLVMLGVAAVIGLSMVSYVVNFIYLIAALVVYGLYLFIKYSNIEYGYSVLNDDIDIVQILGTSKRKRLFSASCKEFEAFVPLESPLHDKIVSNIPNRLYVVTSMKDEGIYFFVASYNEKKTAVYFQPDEKMLNNFLIYNPNVMSNVELP